MKVLIPLIISVLVVLPFTSSSILGRSDDDEHTIQKRDTRQVSFQGCFGGSPTFLESQTREDNNNYNCPEYCKEKGFIIAITKNTFCGCTDTLPDQQIARSDSDEAAGPTSQCNVRCPGAFTSGICYGDECCGGAAGYTVYVVGQIDVMKQVLRRAANNLRADNGKLLHQEFGTGPYRYVQHFGGKCFNTAGGLSSTYNEERLVLGIICDEEKFWFRMLSDGSIQHVTSGKCLHPVGGSAYPSDNTDAVFNDGCSEQRLQFELTAYGSIKHKTSGKCLRPLGGSADPSSGTKVVFHTGCDELTNLFHLQAASNDVSHGWSIRQYSSGKCLRPKGDTANPADLTPVVVHSGCDLPSLWFEMLPDGAIRHMTSGKCFHPLGGSTNPPNGTPVVLYTGCGEVKTLFEKLPNGCIRHKSSGKCLHPLGGSGNPSDNTQLIFSNGCNSETYVFFNFIPKNVPALPDFVLRTIGDTISGNGKTELKECIMKSSISTEKTFDCDGVTKGANLIMEFRSINRELEHGFGKNLMPHGEYDSELDNTNTATDSDMSKQYSVTNSETNSFYTEGGLSLTATFGSSTDIDLGAASTTISSEVSVGGFFTAGYQHDVESSATESLTVTVTVPAYSKGYINLFQETYPLEVKWRATMFAKGTMYVSCAGVTKLFHVSEILDYSQREVYAFGTLKFGERQKIVAIAKIVDKDGNVVKEVNPTVTAI